MASQRRREGYLLIDNRFAPGPAMPFLPNGQEVVGAGARSVFEAATYTCSHCQTQLIRNPARERPREWCWNCDKYICDGCAAARAAQGCVPMKKKLEDEQTRLIREQIRHGFIPEGGHGYR